MKILAVILLIAISASYTHADPAPRIAVNTHHDGTVWPAGIPYVDHGYARPPVRARPVVEEIIERRFLFEYLLQINYLITNILNIIF